MSSFGPESVVLCFVFMFISCSVCFSAVWNIISLCNTKEWNNTEFRDPEKKSEGEEEKNKTKAHFISPHLSMNTFRHEKTERSCVLGVPNTLRL